MDYDYIIIGSNPSGLTLAYYLSKIGKSVLLVDGVQSMNYNSKIDYLYTEEVNIYSDSFINLKQLLKCEFESDFYDLFRPMKFNSEKFFKFKEDIFFSEFISLLINEPVTSLSLDEFITKNYPNCSMQLIDHIDLVCKILLKKSYNETNIIEFINLLNKEITYKFYQPKEPIYDKLYKIWLQNIYNTKNCKVLLDSTIGKINGINNIAQSIEINNKILSANNIIYCIDHKINKTISMVFHWNYKIDLQNIWNLPNSDWELFYLVQSDYTYFNDNRSQIVISVKINNIYAKSLYIYKSAIECTKVELINETFRQLKEVFINLPNPTDISMINNENKLEYENFDNVHIINNNDSYDYIEQSIIKSKKLIHKLENNKTIKIYEPNNFTDIIKFIFIINIIIYLFNLIQI
jgi:hypothetical protein